MAYVYSKQPVKVRIPFLGATQEVGAGDVIARMTKAIGIKPCLPCQRRQAALNRRIVFTGRK